MADVIEQRWAVLRKYTPARIGIGRAGTSQPTRANLQFQLDHARARDAVLMPLDLAELGQGLQTLGMPIESVHSAATDRRVYLQRPDLGRQLPESAFLRLRGLAEQAPQPIDIAVVVADGLSAQAIMAHAQPFLQQLMALLQGYVMAPLCIAEQARVALGDEVGQALKAKLVVMLIGERPGLTAADSLGVYLTWAPARGIVDSGRNCISNIRPGGLDYGAAAQTCHYLVQNAFHKNCTGIALKDQSQTLDSSADQRIPFLRPRIRG